MDRFRFLSETRSNDGQDAVTRRSAFRAYALCIFTMVFCVNAPAPLFELFRRVGKLSPSKLSMLYTAYAGIVIVMLPVYGRASDRFGRRPLVIAGLCSIALGMLVMAITTNFPSLVTGRLFQGLGVAAMSSPAAAALAELAGARSQAFAASTVAVALAIGGASAPLFSGLVADMVPKLPTLPLLSCVVMAVASAARITLLPDPWQPQVMLGSDRSQSLALLTNGEEPPGSLDFIEQPMRCGSGRLAFWQAYVAVVACFGAQVTFFTTAGPILGGLLKTYVLLTAGCAMSALMMASVVGSIAATRLTAEAAMACGMALLAPGVAGFFGLVGMVPSLALTPAIGAIGLGHGLGYAGAMRLINQVAHGAHRAAHTSRLYVAVYIGGGVPVLGMGVLQDLIGRSAASALFGSFMAVLAIGVLLSLSSTTKLLLARIRHRLVPSEK